MKVCTCASCGVELANVADAGFQPVGGVAFHSYGHYGSAEFDPMDGTCVEVVLCDPCFSRADKHTYKAEPQNG